MEAHAAMVCHLALAEGGGHAGKEGDEANAKELVVYQCPEGTCIGKKRVLGKQRRSLWFCQYGFA